MCERIGRIGCVDHDEPKIRRQIFSVGLGFNCVALIFAWFACFAISGDWDLIKAASFSTGILNVPSLTNVTNLKIYVGLTAVAFEDPNGRFANRVIQFGDFCTQYDEIVSTLVSPEQCGTCESSSHGLVTSIIFSCILIIPSITTDIIRMYPNYDVNCQKFLGSIIASASLLASIITFVKYNGECFASFYDGNLYFDRNNSTLASFSTQSAVLVDVAWTPGNGLICIYVATVLKIVDILANVIVPTPTITRDHQEQLEYEEQHLKEQRVEREDENEEIAVEEAATAPNS